MYDIVDYAESGILSSRLKEEMKLLLQMPPTEDVQRQQLSAVTQARLWSITDIILALVLIEQVMITVVEFM